MIVLRAFSCVVLLTALVVAEETGSERAAALNEEGVRLFEKGEYTGALRRFKDALESDPGSKQIRTNLGKTHSAIALSILEEGMKKGGGRSVYRRTVEELNRGLMHWSGDADTHHTVGFCYMQLKDYGAAEQALARVLEDDPKNFRSRRLLAYALEYQGDLAGAERELAKAIELRPSATDLVRRLQRVRHDRQASRTGKTVESEHYRVLAPRELRSETVSTLIATLEKFTVDLEKRWAIQVATPVVVICYPPGKFAENTGLHESVGGAYDGKIRIAFPEELGEGGLELEQVARHEAAHMLLRTLAESPPRWLDEGIAQVLDGDSRDEWKARWLELLEASPNIGLDAREAGFRDDDPDTWAALYLHGFFFVSHLREVGKDFRLDMLVREAGRGNSWESAFETVYGRSVAQMDREWRRDLLKPSKAGRE